MGCYKKRKERKKEKERKKASKNDYKNTVLTRLQLRKIRLCIFKLQIAHGKDTHYSFENKN